MGTVGGERMEDRKELDWLMRMPFPPFAFIHSFVIDKKKVGNRVCVGPYMCVYVGRKKFCRSGRENQ